MAKFRMTNNLLPEGHRGHEAVVDSDSKAFARIVAHLAGAGLSVAHTEAAMLLSRELLEMAPDTRRDFKHDERIDLVVVRLRD